MAAKQTWAKVLVASLALAGIGPAAAAQDDFTGWDLEPGLADAHLVMVARVVRITRVTVVEGAKTDVALREYRFQPVRVLKGLFQRDELSMTASDLGCSAVDGPLAPELEEGEFRLLILAQQSGRSIGGLPSFGCVSMPNGVVSFAQRVPLLSGPDDPLIGVVETLIKVADSRSRRERAELLLDRLAGVSAGVYDGVAAVPLLTSLRLRADWAAEGVGYTPVRPFFGNPPAPPALAWLARRDSRAVRGAAVLAIRDMLAARIKPPERANFTEPIALDGVASALREVLASDEGNASVRAAALEALGHVLAMGVDIDEIRALLIAQATGAATYAERAAAVTALAQAPHPDAVAAVLEALAGLPLDEAEDRERVYVRAAILLDAAGAERVLLERLARSLAARASIGIEVAGLGSMRSLESLQLLLTAGAAPSTTSRDLYAVAWALGRLGDDRAVPALVGWMRRDDFALRERALTALEELDSDAAAREARPLLKPESYLPYKLRLARLLARHGINDGYPLATEHLADDEQTAAAALVLAALDDPRTVGDLTAILEARPDRRWQAAAHTGLVAVGDEDARRQLLEILADDRHPLAADAARAAGLSDDPEFLAPLAKLAQSRNKHLALASLEALHRFLSGMRDAPRGLAAVRREDYDLELKVAYDFDDDPPSIADDLPAETRAAIAEAISTLALDAYVDGAVRQQALAVAQALGGDAYGELLAKFVDQAEMEGSALLTWALDERRRLREANEAR